MKPLISILLALVLGISSLTLTYAADIADTDRFNKMDMLITTMMTDGDPTDGSAWNTESPTAFKWSYINGCMVSAMMKLYETTGDKQYYTFADTYMSPFISTTNSSTAGYIAANNFKYANYTLDDLNNGKALIDLINAGSANSNKYKTAVQSTLYNNILNYMLANQTTTEGNLWHKKVYPYQVWLDGIYMETPFYLQYELDIAGDESAFTEAADNVTMQISNVYTKLRNSNTGLYYHGYDAQADPASGNYNTSSAISWANTETGTSSNYWLRGVGWYAMALVDNIELMQRAEATFGADYSRNISSLTGIYTELMDSMLKYRDTDTCLWYQVIDKPTGEYNYLETSGSAAMSYALMKGYNIGIVGEAYYNAGLETFRGLCDNKLTYTSDGSSVNLTDICGVAGLAGPSSGTTSSSCGRGYKYNKRDGSYEYYVSENTVSNDAKGAAPMIFAYCEILKSDKYVAPSKVGTTVNLGGESAQYTLLPSDLPQGSGQTTNQTSGIFTLTASSTKSVDVSSTHIDLKGGGSKDYRSIVMSVDGKATIDVYYYNNGSDTRYLAVSDGSTELTTLTASANGSADSPQTESYTTSDSFSGSIYIYSKAKGIKITKVVVTYDNSVQGIIGDADNSGTIERADALMVLKHISDISIYEDSNFLTLADCDESGSLDLKDAILLMQYIAENNL